MGARSTDEEQLRAVVMRVCAEGAFVAENRCRPDESRRRLLRLRPVLDALVAEGLVQRHVVGSLTVYIAWPVDPSGAVGRQP